MKTLEALFKKLDISPPLIGALAGLFIDGELMQEFEHLVDEYLPDQKRFIIAGGSPEGMADLFCGYFEQKYFPINTDGVLVEAGPEALETLVRWCPLELYGYDPEYMEWGDVLNDRPGIRLMRACIHSPDGEDSLPYIEEAVKARGAVARRLPVAGFDHEDLMDMCRGTPWQALGEYAEWVHSATGISLLDNCWGEGWEQPSWNKEDVLQWKEEWPQMEGRWDRERKLAALLEEDVTAFGRMVDFLLEKRDAQFEPKKPKTLMEMFSDDADKEAKIRPAKQSDLVEAFRF